ncbi:hypothetical protein HK104_001779 [Borealophlyctis nickersoniae]|nr:hypothetical protein HK104_001779 [Borealophlyctis nickersoniae]
MDDLRRERDRDDLSEIVVMSNASQISKPPSVVEVEGGRLETVEGTAGAAIYTDEQFGAVEDTEVRLYDELHHRHPHKRVKGWLSRMLKPSPARQFFVGNVLHRSRTARDVSWDEVNGIYGGEDDYAEVNN